MSSLEQRVARVEAILRAYDFHEPECPTYAVFVHNGRGLSYMEPKECTCWISEPLEEERHETEVITIPEDGYRGGSDQGWYKAWCICGWESWPAHHSDAEDLGVYHEENPNG